MVAHIEACPGRQVTQNKLQIDLFNMDLTAKIFKQQTYLNSKIFE